MAKAKHRPIVDIHWPAGGLNRQAAIQSQPPFTTAFRAERPQLRSDPDPCPRRFAAGLSKAFSLQLGSGNPIQLLDAAVYVNGPGLTTNILLAISNGTLYSNFTLATTMASVSGSFAASGNYHLQGRRSGFTTSSPITARVCSEPVSPAATARSGPVAATRR